MALDTYQSLLDSVPVWLHREGDPNVMAAAPDMIALAESEINIRLRTRYSEVRFTDVIFEGGIPVPETYLDLKFAYIDGSPVYNLTRKSPDWILSQYPMRSSESRPQFIGRDLDTFIFGPFPDSNYTVKGVYYKQGDSLSLTGTSPLLTRYPKMWLFGTLSHAEKFIRNDPQIDAMMPVWKGEFAQALQEAQDEDDREAMSGGRPRMNLVGVMP